MIVVVDFVAYELPHETYALKEFGLWAIFPDKNNNYLTSYYSFGPPYEWSKLPYKLQLIYEAHREDHGIPWEKGTTAFNLMIPYIVDDLKKVTGIYVADEKAQVILTALIGDYKPIATLEKLGWFDVNEIIKYTCNLHDEKKNNCAYDKARRMVIWIIYNEMMIDATGSEPSISMMQHFDLNKGIK